MSEETAQNDLIDVGGQAAAETTEEKPSPIPEAELSRLTDELIEAFKTVFDPEIPVDIYELGLIYTVDIDDDRNVQILIESLIERWRHKRTRRIADALRARKNGILHLPLLIILDRVIIIRTPSFYRSLNLTRCAVSPTSPSWRLPSRSCWDRR